MKVARRLCIATKGPLIIHIEGVATPWTVHSFPQFHATRQTAFARSRGGRLVNVRAVLRFAVRTERSGLQFDAAFVAGLKRLEGGSW